MNARDSAKNTPLHWAAASGGVDAARLLLDAGADLTLRGAGLTPPAPPRCPPFPLRVPLPYSLRRRRSHASRRRRRPAVTHRRSARSSPAPGLRCGCMSRDMQLGQLARSRLPRGSGAPARGASARRPLTGSRAWRAGRVAFLELLVSRGGNLDSQNDGWPRLRARPQPRLRPHALRRAIKSAFRPRISAKSSDSATARAEGLTARHMINLLVEQNPLA